MRVLLFCHSLVSDWNHGNAHFLRGIVRAFQAEGDEVRVFEPAEGWSRSQMRAETVADGEAGFRAAFPDLSSTGYELDRLDLDAALDGADVVLVHEWNPPDLVARIGAHRRGGGRYRLFFHDTHHRSVTAPEEMAAYDLDGYDGVLAFGAVIAEEYRRRGWGRHAWVWHEAADLTLFRPLAADKTGDLVWIGNWGDEERTAELYEFLLGPIRALRLAARIHGVRYPEAGLAAIAAAGADYGGWLPNWRVPEIFARFRATVHVPRRPYAARLPGIPTIRVFEALACGIPLVSAPWQDAEQLFRPGQDFLYANDGEEMTRRLRDVLHDADLARSLAQSGLETIHARHSCAHRVAELRAICTALDGEVAAASIGAAGIGAAR